MKKTLIILIAIVAIGCKKSDQTPEDKPLFKDRISVAVSSEMTSQLQISFNILGRNGILGQTMIRPSIYYYWCDYDAFNGETVAFNYLANITDPNASIIAIWGGKTYIIIPKGELKLNGRVLIELRK